MSLRLVWLLAALMSVLPFCVLANAPATSLLPTARPGEQAPVVEVPRRRGILANILPVKRPRAEQENSVLKPTAGAAVLRSLLPPKRPKFATVRVTSKPKPNKRGSVCGDRSIRGKEISPIAGKLSGCGVSNPVRITEVDGVKLSVPANVNCNTAKALKKWVSSSVIPAVGRRGGGVASLRVAAHYSCRTRNSRPGAKISEHGKGNAIDISEIILSNGERLTVLNGWRDRSQGKILKRVHKEACGTFGTVLGPNADRYHQDHFHFDVARHRGGAYCR